MLININIEPKDEASEYGDKLRVLRKEVYDGAPDDRDSVADLV